MTDLPAARRRLADAQFLEVLATQRAVRRLTSEPVPLKLVLDCLDLALHAPSGSNRQAWAFVVVGDPGRKAAIAGLNAPGAAAYVRRADVPRRLRDDVAAGAAGMADAPWLVVPCYEIGDASLTHPAAAARYGSIFPAVQGLLLACHAAGLGATLTTMALHDTPALVDLLRLRPGLLPCAVVPVGWPATPLGAPVRSPSALVAFLDDLEHPIRDPAQTRAGRSH